MSTVETRFTTIMKGTPPSQYLFSLRNNSFPNKHSSQRKARGPARLEFNIKSHARDGSFVNPRLIKPQNPLQCIHLQPPPSTFQCTIMTLSSLLPITGTSAAAAASIAECESVNAIIANTSEKLLYLKQIRQQFRRHLVDTDSETRLDVEKMLQELAQPGERAMTRSQLRKRVQDMADQVNTLKQDLDKMRSTTAVLV